MILVKLREDTCPTIQYTCLLFSLVYLALYVRTLCCKCLIVYTVLFDSSIHTVLTDAILIARTATAETLKLASYLCQHIVVKMCRDQHNYTNTNFCHMAFEIKLIASKVPLQGSKQHYMVVSWK